MATMTIENFGDILWPGMYEIADNKFKGQPPMLEQIFSLHPSTKYQERLSSIGSLGKPTQFSGTINYGDIYQGYDKAMTHIEYTLGIQIEYALAKFDQYNIINKRPAALGRSFYNYREELGFNMLNNAVSYTPTDGDAVSLANATHPTLNPAGASQSNLGSTALSAVSLEAARRLMVAFKDDAGHPAGIVPDTLIIPDNLFEIAYEIVSSKGKVDGDNNNVNVHYGRYKIICVPNWLSDTNNWGLADSTLMKESCPWFDAEEDKVKFFKDKSFDTLVSKYAGYMNCSSGWSDWHWLYWSVVS